MRSVTNTTCPSLCLWTNVVGGLALLLIFSAAAPGWAQSKNAPVDAVVPASQFTGKEQALITEIIPSDLLLELEPDHSKLVRTAQPVIRISLVDDRIAAVTQFGKTELEITGLKAGETDLTLWFGDPQQPDRAQILRYRLRVKSSKAIERRRQLEYGELQAMINELFPSSSIELIVVADKLIVRGEARDSEEATNIMAMLRKHTGNANALARNYATVSSGAAAEPNPGSAPLPQTNLINMLRVPGEQQVLLKVRVAELSREALREIGLDFSVAKNNFFISSTLGNAGNIRALLDGRDVSLLLQAVSSNGYSKVLAEPDLVTLSGRTASFIAGGQFAVPTAVGIDGVQAATTFFQGFGTQVLFTPTVVDKDRIRLRVSPTFSSINNANRVNGIPGLNTRSVHTTVDMREGQWLAIAGLLQDEQDGTKLRIPYLGDVPIGNILFGKNHVRRVETELLILVSPQLVHPLEPEAAPCILPGMEVKEPNNHEFFFAGDIEGRACCDHRSTVWPAEQAAVRDAIHESKHHSHYRDTQKFYVPSSHGFSE